MQSTQQESWVRQRRCLKEAPASKFFATSCHLTHLLTWLITPSSLTHSIFCSFLLQTILLVHSFAVMAYFLNSCFHPSTYTSTSYMSVPCACKICRIENVPSVPYNGEFDKIDQIKSCLRILTSHFLTSRPHNLHQQQSFCLSAAFSGYCVYTQISWQSARNMWQP